MLTGEQQVIAVVRGQVLLGFLHYVKKTLAFNLCDMESYWRVEGKAQVSTRLQAYAIEKLRKRTGAEKEISRCSLVISQYFM